MAESEGGQVIPMFDVDELVDAQPVGGVGRVERALRRALTYGAGHNMFGEEHLGLAGSALAGARALDLAERMPGKGGGPYATAALLTPYRETLAALGLVVVADSGDTAPPMEGHTDGSDLLGDLYGTAD